MDSFADVLTGIVMLLIAIDPPASVTVFLSLLGDSSGQKRHKVLHDALLTALVIGVGFLFLGAWVFTLLGIDKADFEIGGGLILVVLSLADLLQGDRAARRRDEFIGVVPIGTPLIVGPAVLTALTVLQTEFGRGVTIAAFLVALAVTALALVLADFVKRAIGTAGLKAVSKIISILLAGFGVHLVRLGLIQILAHAAK